MRRCPCPVWILQPQHTEFRRILGTVDTDTTDARQVVEIASSLADAEQCELHLACVLPYFHDSPLLPSGYAERLASLSRDATLAASSAIAGLVEATGIALPNTRLHCLTGIPGEAISIFAKREHVDLIVMGSVMRTGIDGFTLGNTAEKVLHSVDCSVLTVKPPWVIEAGGR